MKRKDSFSQFLDSLRERPRRERKAIAVGTAGSITAVIAFIWMVNLVTNTDFSTDSITASIANVAEVATEENQRNREILDEYRQRLQVETPPRVATPEIEERFGTRFEEFTRQVVDETQSNVASKESVRQENTVQVPYNNDSSGSNGGLDVLQ